MRTRVWFTLDALRATSDAVALDSHRDTAHQAVFTLVTSDRFLDVGVKI